MIITGTRYIFPPRAETAIPRSELHYYADMGWTGQLKFNDTHILVKYLPGGDIELWNRHAERTRTYTLSDHLKEQLAEVGERLGVSRDHYTLLDGGLLDQKHRAIKDVLVLWDKIVFNDDYLVETEYIDRYNDMTEAAEGSWMYTPENSEWHDPVEFGMRLTDDILMPRCFDAGPNNDWSDIWDIVHTVNKPYMPEPPELISSPLIEGVMLKDPHGTLEMAVKESNNDGWMARSRVHTKRHLF